MFMTAGIDNAYRYVAIVFTALERLHKLTRVIALAKHACNA